MLIAATQLTIHHHCQCHCCFATVKVNVLKRLPVYVVAIIHAAGLAKVVTWCYESFVAVIALNDGCRITTH